MSAPKPIFEQAPADDAAPLLNEVRAFIRRFCVFPSDHCLTAVTLWAAHAHMVEHFHTTPRLAALSAEPESGKTRVLEVLDLLVPAPLFTLNASPAAVFRTLANGQITLLFDEVDAIWSKRGKDDNHEDLRALLNAGYKVGATIPRCTGPKHDVQLFKVFCAVALAGIGDLPDTIMSRSLIIRMRRRAPHERVEEFRTRKNAPEGHEIRDRLAAWAESAGNAAGLAWPKMPPGVTDRSAEIWEPLLAVADAAGGDWPEAARTACVELCKAAADRRVSLGIRLLGDLKTIFGDADALYTSTILERLTAGTDLDADAPWGELRGKPLAVRGLASMLKQYGIQSSKVREPLGAAKQGYRRDDLWDAWQRYLPSPGSGSPEHPEHAEQSSNGEGSTRSGSVPDDFPSGTQAEHRKPATARDVPDVPDVPHLREVESACPSCDGAGCKWCGDTGRNPAVM